MKTVSVIIPLYNRKAFIEETLNSLHPDKQPGVNLQIIVVDDGSNDGGDALVQQNYPHVLLVKQENQGASIARNKGLIYAKGEFTLFLDSDDLIEPNYFLPKIALFEKYPEAAGVYGLWEHFEAVSSGEFKIIPRYTPYPIIEYPDYYEHLANLLGGWYIIIHAVLWKTDIIKNFLFNPNLSINQDVDFLFKILVNKYVIVSTHGLPKAFYRKQLNSSTGEVSNQKKLEDMYRLRIQFIEELKNKSLWDSKLQTELAKFCFGVWKAYRRKFPKVANDFYKLSKKLGYSSIKNGSLFDEWVSRVIGPKNTVLLKDGFKKLVF
jgi:glycosyltransferase involved in cell wall biosynthesis